MLHVYNDFNASDRMLDKTITDNLDLLEFLISNLDHAHLSNETFLPRNLSQKNISTQNHQRNEVELR